MHNKPRHVLARLLKDFFGVNAKISGAEIGVEKGNTSKYLCSRLQNLTLYCIDPWSTEHHDVHGKKGRHRREVSQNEYDFNYQETAKKLGPYGHRACIMRQASLDAVWSFEDESIDFAFIDANHGYEFARADIRAWWPKVRQGGLLICHDYTMDFTGVWDAFNEFAAELDFKPPYQLPRTVGYIIKPVIF